MVCYKDWSLCSKRKLIRTGWLEEDPQRIGAREDSRNITYLLGQSGSYYTLGLWSGLNLKGAPGDTMRLPRGHPIIIFVQDASGEHPDITFETGNNGKFADNDSSVYTTTSNNLFFSAVFQKHVEIATATLLFSETDPGEPPHYNKHEITITCGNYRFHLPAYCYKNSEPSRNIGNYTHQKDPETDLEILGDLYNGKDLVNEPPHYTSDWKDVLIELDWYKWTDSVDKDTIQAIADLVKTIIETAGVKYNIAIDTETPEGDTFQIEPGKIPPIIDMSNKKQVRTLLASTRTMNEDFWEPRIHLILGSSDGVIPGRCGEVHQIHHALLGQIDMCYYSSGENSPAYNDSVGAIVFAKKINEMNPHTYITDIQNIALCAAHEIGHCLGLWHYPYSLPNVGYNVMEITMDFSYEDCYYTYDQFEPKTLCGDYDDGTGYFVGSKPREGYAWDGFNTRHIIGINRTALDEYVWNYRKPNEKFTITNSRKEYLK